MSGRARTPVQGEVPNPLNPPRGLRLPSALPACQRALPGGAAGAAADRRRPGRLPRGRGRADLRLGRALGVAQASGSRRSPRIRSAMRLALADQPRLARPTTITSAARGRRVVVAGHAHRVGAGRQDGERRRRARRRARGRGRASRPTRRSGRRRPRSRRRRCAAHALDDAASRRRTSPAASGRSSPRRRCRSSSSRRGLRYEHLADQHAGVADQRAAGLEQELAMRRGRARRCARAGARSASSASGGVSSRVGDAEAAAEVEVARCAMPSRLDAPRPGRAGGRARRGRARSR